MTATTITDRRTTVRRQADHVRVTPDMVVAAVIDELAPLLASGDPDQIAVAHAVAPAVGMLQR